MSIGKYLYIDEMCPKESKGNGKLEQKIWGERDI